MARIAYFTISASAVLSLTACGPKADTPAKNVANDTVVDANETTPTGIAPGQAFANTAASSDAFEIEASKLAAEKSESSAVQAFARQMIAAHTESTTKLNSAATSARPAITPDPALTAEQQETLTALQVKSGADFDTAYAAGQVIAHQATLDSLRAYASTGDVPQLKEFAGSMTPIVAAHLNMAKSLKP